MQVPKGKNGNSEKRTIAIVGPKGGVGKSTISANLAIALAGMGKRVVAVDLDLGAANLHAILGIRESKYTLDSFIMGKTRNLSDVVVETGIKNLGMISGGDVPGIANMAYQQKMKLIGQLLRLDSDIIIFDLGAGSSNNVIDFLIIAQTGLIVTTPEVPSLLNVYSFIKTTIFRRLNFLFKSANAPKLLELLDMARDPEKYPSLKTMEGFLKEVSEINPDSAEAVRKILAGFKFFIAVNRVQRSTDASTGDVIQNLMKQYLSIHTSEVLTTREDSQVRNAIARLKPVMIQSPTCGFCSDIMQIARRLGNGV